MTAKDIVIELTEVFAVPKINWGQQMILAKQLLKKHTAEEICFALRYWKTKGKNIYSLGFLLRAMDEPLSVYKAEKYSIGGDSGERNRQRIQIKNSKAEHRTSYPIDLFAG